MNCSVRATTRSSTTATSPFLYLIIDATESRGRSLHASAPNTYISHFTAAELWGGVVPDAPDVHVSGPDQTHRCRRRGVKAHTSDGKPAPIHHRGLAISSPAQTFLDLAAVGLSLVELVVLGDSLVKGRADRPDGADPGRGGVGWPWGQAGPARRQLRSGRRRLGDGKSRLRMLIVLGGSAGARGVNVISATRERLELADPARPLLRGVPTAGRVRRTDSTPRTPGNGGCDITRAGDLGPDGHSPADRDE